MARKTTRDQTPRQCLDCKVACSPDALCPCCISIERDRLKEG